MKLKLVRVPNGYAFADAESAKAADKHRLGETVVATVVKPRSRPFQRKFFALLRFGFDYWEPEAGEAPRVYRGKVIEKDFERFRSDITILCGFYHPVWNARGEMRVEADSIAFDEMDAEDFKRLYSKAISVLLDLVLASKGFSAQEIDRAVEELLRFD